MKFVRLTLQNIRSYTKADIKFPSGTVLLSGDIGSGKSSILLALEFALFGITKGEVSGEMLLRHGCDRAEVGLSLHIGEHDVHIVRTLKRTSRGVVQDSGSLRVDGIITPLTPTELKARILALLCYPADLVTKKSLIYRYTVYTPQEQMKWILLGDKSLRLDTLRRVFSVDAYQRVAENVKIVVRGFRDQRKKLEGRLHDVPELLAERYTLAEKRSALQTEKHLLQQTQQEHLGQVNMQQEEVTRLEAALRAHASLRQELSGLVEQQRSLAQVAQRYDQQLATLVARKGELAALHTEEHYTGDVAGQLAAVREKISQLRGTQNQLQKDEQQQQFFLDAAAKVQSRLSDLSTCPVCEQEVSAAHKQTICSREEQNVLSAQSALRDIQAKMVQSSEEMVLLEAQQQQFVSTQQRVQVLAAQREELARLVTSEQELVLQQRATQQQRASLSARQEVIMQELSCDSDQEQRYAAAKVRLGELRSAEQHTLISVARVEKSLEDVDSRIQIVQATILEKEQLQLSRQRLLNLTSWCTTYLLPLLIDIEQKVMQRLRCDFAQLFVQWFSLLMGSEDISVSLDAQFTPCVLQQGHDIAYTHLSGGEKTALALAYRLALNQVVTTRAQGLQTHDVIILDEPTDGFSSSQIDRLRLVLDELAMQQVLLVSHEPKIASFCDTVITLEKQGHETVVKR